MKVLAPLVIIFALSGALYQTKEVWPKVDYDAAKSAKGASASSASGPQPVRAQVASN